MRMRRTLAYLVFASCVLGVVIKNRAAEVRSGDWTISKSDNPGKVEFSLIEHHHGGSSNHQSDWPATSFQGVDLSKAGRQDVHFTITRDAGRIDCEGFLNDGEGAGLFHFQPDPNFPREMQSLGFSIDDEKQFGMAVQDVTLDFAKQMKGEHLSDLDADTLIAMRIHGATPEWMAQLKQRGYDHIELEKLIAYRIHGVSPEFIGKVQG